MTEYPECQGNVWILSRARRYAIFITVRRLAAGLSSNLDGFGGFGAGFGLRLFCAVDRPWSGSEAISSNSNYLIGYP